MRMTHCTESCLEFAQSCTKKTDLSSTGRKTASRKTVQRLYGLNFFTFFLGNIYRKIGKSQRLQCHGRQVDVLIPRAFRRFLQPFRGHQQELRNLSEADPT